MQKTFSKKLKIAVTEQHASYLENQVKDGHYASVSELVRDLIRQHVESDRRQHAKIAA